MDKDKQLARIAKEIELCRICKKGKTGKAVSGEWAYHSGSEFVATPREIQFLKLLRIPT